MSRRRSMEERRGHPRTQSTWYSRSSRAAAIFVRGCGVASLHAASAFTFVVPHHHRDRPRRRTPSSASTAGLSSYHSTPRPPLPTSLSMVYAPPGSGYADSEDETSYFPDTYLPTMEYPGTMRPGMTRENIPLQDLPIADSDPDPVPWPHLQEIGFYHVWGAPHPHPQTPNEVIYEYGRWATAEEEAEMIRDARRGVRRMRELAEEEKRGYVVVDDEEDDEVEVVAGAKGRAGAMEAEIEEEDGMDAEEDEEDLDLDIDIAALGREVDEQVEGGGTEDEEAGDDVISVGGEDFLLDLGLDADDDEDVDEDD